MAKPIKRSFYYYNVALLRSQKDETGKSSLTSMKNQKNIFYKMFDFLKSLQESEDDADRKKLIADMAGGDKLYIIVDFVEKEKPIRFRLVWCRADAMPFIEENGVLSLITDYLENDFTLAEITHCVIFPESGIMGAEFNFSGARATSIRWYLPRVYEKISYVSCKDRLNADAIKKLSTGVPFSLFKLTVQNSPEVLTKLAAKKSVFLIAASGMPSEVDTYEVTLKRRKTKRKRGFDSPIPIDEMENFIRENRDFIKSFEVSQGSIMKDSVNLLEDKLVTTQEIIPTLKKVIDSKEAYKIIIDYYEEAVKPT
ncbi:hypothetical protein AAAU98_27715 [Enterocloster citroniae]|uniref:hypothetical protein n=1 Tax=Enterocloster citroniae TaxID=358743 RepID=UPI0032C1BFD2